jgi:hypothetical protein
VEDDIVEEIEEQITELILPTTLDDALTDYADFQVTLVSNESDQYENFVDTDNSIKYFIKTTTWEHLAVQKN